MTKERVMADAVAKMQLNVEKGVEIINSHLRAVETAGNDAARSLYSQMPAPEVVYGDMRHFMDGNPEIQGILFGFVDGLFDKYGEHRFCPIVERTDTGLIADNALLTDPHLYDAEWFAETKRVDHPRWSNVMRDVHGPNIVCYCIPMHGKRGKFLGVMTVSLAMNSFSDILAKEIHPYEHSSVYVTDDDGHFLVHPDHTQILRTVDEYVHEKKLMIDEELWKSFSNDESGFGEIDNSSGGKSLLYFAPIKSADWNLSIVSENDEILADYYFMTRMMFVVGLLSIILLVLIGYYLYLRIFREVEEHTNVESEVRIAGTIQRSMIPGEMSHEEEFDLSALLHPAKSIGGDLYDYRLKDGKLYFCIGDVSGKGIPASLVMAVAQCIFSMSVKRTDSPAEIACNINNVLAERNEMNMFCTMFVGVLDLATGRLAYCNAGHNRPIFVSASSEQKPLFMDVKANIPLGVMEDFPYVEEMCTLQRGDKLFTYTDGVTEAMDVHDRAFGDEAALAFATENRYFTPQDLVDGMLVKVKHFAEDAEQSDDITMLCLQWNGKAVKELSLQLINDIGETSKLSGFVKSLEEQLQVPKFVLFNVHLALDEMLANVISYAYPDKTGQPISLVARRTDDALVCEICDAGQPFNPLTSAPEVDTSQSIEERPIGGLGILISRKVADHMEYERKEGHNILHLTFSIPQSEDFPKTS